LFCFRKQVCKPATLRPEIADAEMARQRRQVEKNSAGPLEFQGDPFT
jgi:hypothetical protein